MESVSRDRLTRMYVSSLPRLYSWNKMLYLCHYRRRQHTVSAEPGGHFLLLPLTNEQVHVFARVRLSVCLSVSEITQKRVHGLAWNVACRQMSRHGKLINFFSPIRIIVRMPEPHCCVPYRISAATRNFITSGKSHIYVLTARRCKRRVLLKWVLFISSCRNTFVGCTCALPSVLLVCTCYL